MSLFESTSLSFMYIYIYICIVDFDVGVKLILYVTQSFTYTVRHKENIFFMSDDHTYYTVYVKLGVILRINQTSTSKTTMLLCI